MGCLESCAAEQDELCS